MSYYDGLSMKEIIFTGLLSSFFIMSSVFFPDGSHPAQLIHTKSFWWSAISY